MVFRKIGVLGCGLMGSRIAQVSAAAGYEVWVREVEQRFLDKGFDTLKKSMNREVEKGKLKSEDMERTLARLHGTLHLEDLKDCGLIIEAAVEDIQIKRDLFSALDRLCGPETILASNTSSLTVIEMAAATQRADRVVGLHFFNPAHVMKLVEVVQTIATSAETFGKAFDFVRSIDKVPIAAKDRSGFIVNLLLVPYLLDAIRALESGLASIEDIDTGMKLGCGYPMGPFTLLDFVGLDTTYRIANIMYEEYREGKYAPPPLLRKMVLAGYYGTKSGKGFYDYAGEKPVVNKMVI
ncbi:MAG: 3-hydroxybutyryl-CoA dehydrogenase [Candidatus Tectomicrobia bacterium]|uniref:3-hydroxybutyryl-CoA dehydrogenase n=1 Tax=Tectimicrobiota bacterium TaxID=2528274 RepID=A0A932M1S3_UNCTE|nr:3-hydroxybutyryl-CoA dehydrogenase [Candidatus Tectomicrobia bacterium]